MGVDSELNPELTPQGDAVVLGQVMRYAGLRSWDARGRAMPSRLEVGEHEIRIVVDDRHAEYPLVVDPTWVQQAEFTNPGPGSNFSGQGVGVSGDTAVVSAGAPDFSASAYVYVRDAFATWSLQQALQPADLVGTSSRGPVAISGDTIVVAIGLDAYVFVRGGSPPTWTQQQKLTISGGGYLPSRWMGIPSCSAR